MTILAGFSRRRPIPSAHPPPPAMAAEGADLRLVVANVEVLLCAGGTLWLPALRTLVVSDMHLEKGSAFGRLGQMLPPYDTRTTLSRLAARMDTLRPEIVVSLGDSFHDPSAAERLDADDRVRLCELVSRVDWVWVEGNHDPAPPSGVGGRAAAELALGGLTFRHEPGPSTARGEVCGHLHPCARVIGRGHSVRRRCFATDGTRLVMPAFGAYAGGLNVRDAAFASVFPDGCYALVLGREKVYPASPERLMADV